MSLAFSTPSGTVSRSTIGMFFRPRCLTIDQTSCSLSLGRQNVTSRVITWEAAIVQLQPVHWLIRLTTSVLVITPVIFPQSSQTTTRFCRGPFSSFAASISKASVFTVTSLSSTTGKICSTVSTSYDSHPFSIDVPLPGWSQVTVQTPTEIRSVATIPATASTKHTK